MDEIAQALRRITGWQVHQWPDPSAVPPAAVVVYPDEIVYDATYGRGADTLTLPVVVLAGTASDLTTRDALVAYMAGSGPRSVKQAIESGRYTGIDEIRVTRAEPGPYQAGGLSYLACVFDVDIIGSGV